MKTNRPQAQSAAGRRAPRSPWARQRLEFLAIFCTLAGAFGCDQPGPRVYSAMAFDPTTQCLEPYAPLGLVQAEELPATCAPVCLMLDTTLYVSEVCPPYPTETTPLNAAESPACAKALSLIDADGGACEVAP